MLVVKIAQIVPIGILFWASAKSPERFDPAIIPVVILMRTKKKSVEQIIHNFAYYLHQYAVK